MIVSKNDAAEALAVIERSGDQMQTLRRYGRFAPYLLIWGLVWIAANGVTDLAPAWSPRAWLIGSAIGLALSVLWGIRILRSSGSRVPGDAERRPRVRGFVMTGLMLGCYFPAMYAVLGPFSARQENAFVSLSWAFAYMIAGAWIGWRLFAIGGIAAAAVVFGYLGIEQHYYLWMAACGGGTLIAGALWLRKI
jgi:hypothetical protein